MPVLWEGAGNGGAVWGIQLGVKGESCGWIGGAHQATCLRWGGSRRVLGAHISGKQILQVLCTLTPQE